MSIVKEREKLALDAIKQAFGTRLEKTLICLLSITWRSCRRAIGYNILAQRLRKLPPSLTGVQFFMGRWRD